jgi:hypothetical protein
MFTAQSWEGRAAAGGRASSQIFPNLSSDNIAFPDRTPDHAIPKVELALASASIPEDAGYLYIASS